MRGLRLSECSDRVLVYFMIAMWLAGVAVGGGLVWALVLAEVLGL